MRALTSPHCSTLSTATLNFCHVNGVATAPFPSADTEALLSLPNAAISMACVLSDHALLLSHVAMACATAAVCAARQDVNGDVTASLILFFSLLPCCMYNRHTRRRPKGELQLVAVISIEGISFKRVFKESECPPARQWQPRSLSAKL
jgi:hypothetical protein